MPSAAEKLIVIPPYAVFLTRFPHTARCPAGAAGKINSRMRSSAGLYHTGLAATKKSYFVCVRFTKRNFNSHAQFYRDKILRSRLINLINLINPSLERNFTLVIVLEILIKNIFQFYWNGIWSKKLIDLNALISICIKKLKILTIIFKLFLKFVDLLDLWNLHISLFNIYFNLFLPHVLYLIHFFISDLLDYFNIRKSIILYAVKNDQSWLIVKFGHYIYIKIANLLRPSRAPLYLHWSRRKLTVIPRALRGILFKFLTESRYRDGSSIKWPSHEIGGAGSRMEIFPLVHFVSRLAPKSIS